MPELPSEALSELEDDLNQTTFLGVPLGASLNDAVLISLCNGRYDFGPLSMARDVLSLLRSWSGLRGRSSPAEPHRPGSILVVWAGDTPRLNDLMLPVVRELGTHECTILVRRRPGSSLQRAGLASLSWESLPRFDLKAWRAEFWHCLPRWKRDVSRFAARHRLGPGAVTFLLAALAAQTQKLMRCRALLENLQPRAIVTDFDRNSDSSCLLLAAARHHIPTATLVHGVVGAYGYTPLIADVACCWGALQERQLRLQGVPRDRLRITGCPRLLRTVGADRGEQRFRLGIRDDLPVVLFATSPVAHATAWRIAGLFCQAMALLPSVHGVVRLHPAESAREYRQLQQRYPSVQFLPSSRGTVEQALAAADLVIVESSGFGNDAVVYGKCTAILRPPGLDSVNARELVELAGCPVSTSAADLARAVTRILGDPVLRARLLEQGNAYSAQFSAFCGQEAADKIAREVRSLAGKGASDPGADRVDSQHAANSVSPRSGT